MIRASRTKATLPRPAKSRSLATAKKEARAGSALVALAAKCAQQEVAFIYDPLFAGGKAAGLDALATLESFEPGDLLSATDEAQLFLAMNYFKYRANLVRGTIDLARPRPEPIAEMQALLANSRAIRDRLIQANLRLVISIARRFVDQNATLEELVSDGNLTLMQAVEKFDAGRGFRFSTYATHAIQRCYFARLRRRAKSLRLTQAGEDQLEQLADSADDNSGPEDLQRLRRLHRLLTEKLDDRERLVLTARFGIDEEAGPQTLRHVAKRLNLSKERIRQLQMRAIKTLQAFAEVGSDGCQP